MGKEYNWRSAVNIMKTIHIICEGKTEVDFVNKILWDNLGYDKYRLEPKTIITNADKKAGKIYKGGVSNFAKIDRDIKRVLHSIKNADTYITTMFDYYGLPDDFPGMVQSKSITDIYQRIEKIEDALGSCYKCSQFIPYIQLHEFETLIFSDIESLKKVFFDECDSIGWQLLYDAVSEFKNVELINNDINSAPSKRLKQCIKSYDKVYSGIQALQSTDFKLIRQQCRHFNEWITQLESL